jgi:protocatechuate 3,4-dioxygenase beta subunit
LDGLARDGSYVAFADADGWAQSERREGRLVSDASAVTDADFVLRRLGALVVHVLDVEGHPVRVPLSFEPDPLEMQSDLGTGDDGVAEFPSVTPGEYVVTAFAAGAPEATASVVVHETETVQATLRFVRGATIEGIVVDERGAPVPSVHVRAHRPGGATQPESGDMVFPGPDGEFLLNGLRRGPHVVDLLDRPDVAPVAIDVGTDRERVRIVAPRPASVRIRLLHDDRPVESFGVIASIRPVSGGKPAELLDGSPGGIGNGAFLLRPIPAGVHVLQVSSWQLAPYTSPPFTLAPGERADLGEIRLDAGVELTGRVLDAAGAPIPGAKVRVGEISGGVYRLSEVAAAGMFRLVHMALGRTTLVVTAPEFAPATIEADVAADAAPLVIRLPRGGVVHATVVDAAGDPVVGATVDFDAPGLVAPPYPWRTDFRGRVEARVPVGRCRVTVDGRGVSDTVDVAEGGEASLRIVVR